MLLQRCLILLKASEAFGVVIELQCYIVSVTFRAILRLKCMLSETAYYEVDFAITSDEYSKSILLAVNSAHVLVALTNALESKFAPNRLVLGVRSLISNFASNLLERNFMLTITVYRHFVSGPYAGMIQCQQNHALVHAWRKYLASWTRV